MTDFDWKGLAARQAPAIAAAAGLAVLAWIAFDRATETAWAVHGHKILNGELATAPEGRDALIAAALSAEPRTAEARSLVVSAAMQAEPRQIERAEEAALAALIRSPARPDVWAQTSYIEMTRSGELSNLANIALERSYFLQPYSDEAMAEWRLGRVVRYWPQVSPELRAAALREARRMRRSRVRALAEDARHPEARAALEGIG